MTRKRFHAVSSCIRLERSELKRPLRIKPGPMVRTRYARIRKIMAGVREWKMPDIRRRMEITQPARHVHKSAVNVSHTQRGADGFKCFSTETIWYNDSWFIFMATV